MIGHRRAPTYDELVTSCQVAVAELEHATATLRALVPAQPIVFRLQLGADADQPCERCVHTW